MPPTNGIGTNYVWYTVDLNPVTVERIGAILIGDKSLTLTQQEFSCSFTISPASRQHGPGGTVDDSVTLRTSNQCEWIVVNTNDWIRLLSENNGIGSNFIHYAMDPNQYPIGRTGLVMIADKILTLSQEPLICTYRLSPSFRPHGAGATSGGINVIVNGAGCPWGVTNDNDWISFPVMNGSGTVSNFAYFITANPRTTSRTGMVVIAGQVLTITQSGTSNGGAFSEITTLEGGQISLRLTGPVGAVWALQRSSDLIDWDPVTTVTNTTGTVDYIDTPPAGNRCFYRALLE
jgi:hypothetical protein